MSYDTSVHSRVINAFFDTQATATAAVDKLVEAGVPREHISLTGGETAGTTGTTSDNRGFWDSLKDMFLPEEDRYAYAEGLRRGGYLVTVRTEDANYNRVLDILDIDGSVDMDERETQWRSEGWTGYQGASSLAGTRTTSMAQTTLTEPVAYTATETTASRAAALGTATTGTASATLAGDKDTVQLYEEQLRVGKRDINHGKVRLRSYVVETPVSESVSLREESVTIDRKPVNRPVSVNDAVFQDRVIEVDEYAEEAVIAKEARVTEEISLHKTTENRVQTVTDTVRHTEVEVEDGRTVGVGQKVSAFSATTDASLIVPHMEVISADGQTIGTVDHLDGPDHIKLAKNTSPDGHHHLVPFAWIDHIDQHVHLKRTLAEIKADT